MKNTIFKKQIILQLEKGPSARHLIFNIELRHTQSARNFETLEEVADPVELSICGATHLRGCSCQMRERILTFKNRENCIVIPGNLTKILLIIVISYTSCYT